MKQRWGIRILGELVIAGIMILSLLLQSAVAASDTDQSEPELFTDEGIAALMSPVTSGIIRNVDAFFGTISATLTGKLEIKAAPGMDYVCPHPLNQDDVFEQQQDWGDNEGYMASQRFWWFDNAGPGTELYPLGMGDGSKHFIKISAINGMSDFTVYCIENMFNPQENRKKDESKTKACIRDTLQEECVTLTMGECAMISGFTVCAAPKDDQICASPFLAGLVDFGTGDSCQEGGRYLTHGAMCLKALETFLTTNKLDNCVCYPQWIPKTCTDGFRLGLAHGDELKKLGVIKDGTMLASFVDKGWQLSGPVVECVEDTLANIFHARKRDCTGQVVPSNTIFTNFQSKMQKSVTALMVLAVIIFAMKTILLQYNPGGQDLLMMLVKFSIVGWFALGGGAEYFYDGMIGSARSLVEAMIDASSHGGNQMCNLLTKIQDAHLAEGALDHRILKLAVWTEFDCKLLTYIGFGTFTDGEIDFPYMLLIAVALILIGPIGLVVLVLMVVCLAFLLLAALQSIHIFVLASIASTILLFFAPIFVPMVLFEYTKPFFEAWLKELLGHTLYPMGVFLYIGMLMITLDLYMFGDLDKYPDTFDKLGNFNVDACDPDAVVCEVYRFKDQILDEPYTIIGGILAYMTIVNVTTDIDAQIDLLVAAIIMTLVMFMFYSFYGVLMNLLGELSGSVTTNIGTQLSMNFVKIGMPIVMKYAEKFAQGVMKIMQKIASLVETAVMLVLSVVMIVVSVAVTVAVGVIIAVVGLVTTVLEAAIVVADVIGEVIAIVAEVAVEVVAEVVVDLVIDLITELVETLIEMIVEAVVELVVDLVSEVVESLVGDLLSDTVTEMLEEILEKGVEEVIQDLLEKGVKEVIEELPQKVMDEVEDIVKEIPQKIVQEAEDMVKDVTELPQKLVKEAIDEIKDLPQKAVKKVVKKAEDLVDKVIDKANDLRKHSAEMAVNEILHLAREGFS